jgi:hypothetical protein
VARKKKGGLSKNGDGRRVTAKQIKHHLALNGQIKPEEMKATELVWRRDLEAKAKKEAK